MLILDCMVLPILLLTIPNAGVKSQNVTCQQSWTEYNNHCYRLFIDAKSWSDAQNECRNHGSNLVTIETQEENAWLKQIIQNQPWIGAYTDETRTWRWVSDNSTLTYTDWGSGEPNDNNDDEDCVHYLHNQGWNDATCTDTLPFLCEKLYFLVPSLCRRTAAVRCIYTQVRSELSFADCWMLITDPLSILLPEYTLQLPMHSLKSPSKFSFGFVPYTSCGLSVTGQAYHLWHY